MPCVMLLSWINQELVSPVVKEKGYFAPYEPDAQGGGPAGRIRASGTEA